MRRAHTLSGGYVEFHENGDVVIERIDIYDIAHHLSNICRFGGSCRQFYSLAQHCVLVSYHCKNKLEGLLHDAPKAYLGEPISPFRELLGSAYPRILSSIALQIQLHFGLQNWRDLPDVREANRSVRAAEARDLLHKNSSNWKSVKGIEPIQPKIIPVPPMRAMEAFLKRFGQLHND